MKKSILFFLVDALEREELVLSMGLKKNKQERDIQEGKIAGINLAIYLIETNF